MQSSFTATAINLVRRTSIKLLNNLSPLWRFNVLWIMLLWRKWQLSSEDIKPNWEKAHVVWRAVPPCLSRKEVVKTTPWGQPRHIFLIFLTFILFVSSIHQLPYSKRGIVLQIKNNPHRVVNHCGLVLVVPRNNSEGFVLMCCCCVAGLFAVLFNGKVDNQVQMFLLKLFFCQSGVCVCV